MNVAHYDQDNLTVKHKNLWDPLTKKRALRTPLNEYTSGTKIKNYLLKDPVLDWYDMYYESRGLNENPKKRPRKNSYSKPVNGDDVEIFFEEGNKFEKNICSYLNRKFEGEITTINNDGVDGVNLRNYNLTVEAIFKGIPIILQGVLINHDNKTRGVADILIRSDYINKLVTHKVISEKKEHIKASNLSGNYHYLVVDIKWCTMTLCANGYNIRNEGRFPAYKGQLAIYTSILGEIQGYTPSEAYIMAKAWKVDSKNNANSGYNCFDILGVIDYDGFDNQYVQLVSNSIDWIKDLKKHGSNWSPLNPLRQEMYPNLSNKLDAPWTEIKNAVGSTINEISEVWCVGHANRVQAHSQGIYSWKDPMCDSVTLGITGESKPDTIDAILEVNRSKKHTILPQKIKNNMCNWQKSSPVDFYVDFETLNACFLERCSDIQNSSTEPDMIFMIGVGYIVNDQWHSTQFVAKSATLSEEKFIVNEFVNFINSISIKFTEFVPRLFHWSQAEPTNFYHAMNRHNMKWEQWLSSIVWVDMYDVFVREPIVVKGALNFRLKSIGKAMHKLGYIETTWENNGVNDGLQAMMSAIKLYKQKLNDESYDVTQDKTMLNIIKYNENDCKIMWEIVQCLRVLK